MPDRSWITVFIPTPLIFRYHLPLKIMKASWKQTRYYQCCGSGSGIRCFFDTWNRVPGWAFSGSWPRIPNAKPAHISESFVTIFWVKIFNSLSPGSIFFTFSKNNNLKFCEIYGYKKVGQKMKLALWHLFKIFLMFTVRSKIVKVPVLVPFIQIKH